ncbi:alpha-amylase-like [Mizuhopecten yessoensis]|uniref:alpha-amylase-like n=1 Tax=Mizuhopecten yessoensis TaxID=6573 RepID=UPI000B459DE6|nr:alpha-amylase-like [Mizuhopecten yessoensis]
MTGVGGSGTGTAGSHWDGDSLSYPGVPFSAWDFNSGSECHSSDMNIHDYNNAEEVRNCRLVSLADLKLSKNYVRDEIAGYMNHLINIGVAGFRVDAAKHMWPGDLRSLFGKLTNLNSGVFGSGVKPFIFQEVIDMGSEPISASEYIGIGRVTNFIFGAKLGQVFRNENKASYLHNWGEAWNMPNSNDVVVFIDNHDNQRGHGGGGGPITHFEPRPYKLATTFMLAHPYGFTRLMSSYNFDRSNTDQGPPHHGDTINDVTINGDQTCGNGWVSYLYVLNYLRIPTTTSAYNHNRYLLLHNIIPTVIGIRLRALYIALYYHTLYTVHVEYEFDKVRSYARMEIIMCGRLNCT